MRRIRQQVERFNECPRCDGKNTCQNGTFDDEYHIQFYGWCFDCDHGYSYDMRVQTVEDKKGRL